jgi:hypothetical protein
MKTEVETILSDVDVDIFRLMDVWRQQPEERHLESLARGAAAMTRYHRRDAAFKAWAEKYHPRTKGAR